MGVFVLEDSAAHTQILPTEGVHGLFFFILFHEQVLALAVTETCLCSRRRHCTASLITH